MNQPDLSDTLEYLQKNKKQASEERLHKKTINKFELLQRNYLHDDNLKLQPIEKKQNENHYHFFKVDKIIFDPDEDNQEKLKSVYSAVHKTDCTIVMILYRDDNYKDNLYLGVVHHDDSIASFGFTTLKGAFAGNFGNLKLTPTDLGIKYKPGNEQKSNTEQKSFYFGKINEGKTEHEYESVTIAQITPHLKSDQQNQQTDFCQGLEKFANSTKSIKSEFSAIFMAKPISNKDLNENEKDLCDIATKISFFANLEGSVSKSLNPESTQTSTNYSWTFDENATILGDNNKDKVENIQKERNKYKSNPSKHFQDLNKVIPTILNGVIPTIKVRPDSYNIATSKAITEETVSQSHNLNFKTENKLINHTLERIDENLKRIIVGKNQGMWEYSCYYLSHSPDIAKTCASIMNGIMSGGHETEQHNHIKTFNNEVHVKTILNSLRNFQIPQFQDKNKDGQEEITISSNITNNELIVGMPLPEKSINGIMVKEQLPFARNIYKGDEASDNEIIKLGKIKYLDQADTTRVRLKTDKLTQHVFVVGTTGSGKSNTIQVLLNQIKNKTYQIENPKNNSQNKTGKITYLIIEPAKGEYKNIYGNQKDVHVFGANRRNTKLLKINPFTFPDSTTVTEHMDKLVDIFNSAWSMEAAMSPILKTSLEHAYEQHGWNIAMSEQIKDQETYPNFHDLIKSLQFIINNSGFSERLKGDYTGSLVERMRELTKGFYTDIFVNDEIDNQILFEENCIVDLSNIGSLRTKSLIMGMLFIRLQEHRIHQRATGDIQPDSPLRHITILEEAHNLLPNLSGKNGNGDNSAAKSVEMISNAIAEMRTYGEGFIIVDQSPEKVDISAIKNTNTKIIHSLPDYNDCKIAGFAAGVNEDQLNELATLERGHAVVFQSDWHLPVLCQIDKANSKQSETYKHDTTDILPNNKLMQISQISHQSTINSSTKMQLIDNVLQLRDLRQKYNSNSEQDQEQIRKYLALHLYPGHGKIIKDYQIKNIKRMRTSIIQTIFLPPGAEKGQYEMHPLYEAYPILPTKKET